jgi:glycosyltransferase involved in cell wall biosynthesis
MRVLYFSRDYTSHDHRFLAAMVENGIQPFYLRLERSGHPQEDRMLPVGVTPVQWEGGQKPFEHLDHRRLLSSLKSVLKSIKPDILHAGPVQTAAWLAAQSRFHPLVTMSWGSDLLLDADSSAQMRRLTEFALANTDVLVGDCDTVREKAISFGFPSEKIVTFPWGVNLERFSPAEAERVIRQRAGWQEEFVILHTRTWEPVYGVEIFTKAFARAAALRPDLRLFLLGNGSMAAEIRKILMPVMHKVQFVGQVNQEKLPAYYQAADLYVSASRSDGSSVSLMEALACGLPVLVSDIPGNREWLDGSEAGWMFPDGDADALSARILEIADQRGKLEKTGRQARQLAETRANWSENFKKLLTAYQMALKV